MTSHTFSTNYPPPNRTLRPLIISDYKFKHTILCIYGIYCNFSFLDFSFKYYWIQNTCRDLRTRIAVLSLFSISWQVFQLVYIFWCIYLLTHWIHSINVAILYLIDSMKRFQNVKLSFCIHLWVCRFWEHLKAIGMNNGCVASDESIDHHEL